MGRHIPRRTVARGAAWTVPLVAVAHAAPAYAASPGDPVGACWQSTSGINDLHYAGPATSRSNTFLKETNNGTCSGNNQFFYTVVRAGTIQEANQRCAELLNTTTSGTLNGLGYSSAPPDFWLCGQPPL